MLAFKVSINRKKVSIAGAPGPHVVSAILTSVERDPADRRLWEQPSRFTRKELDFSLGGLISHSDGTKEHVSWTHLKLSLGDMVSIRVVDSPRADEPRVRAKAEQIWSPQHLLERTKK